jgi:hypothetical protein
MDAYPTPPPKNKPPRKQASPSQHLIRKVRDAAGQKKMKEEAEGGATQGMGGLQLQVEDFTSSSSLLLLLLPLLLLLLPLPGWRR